MQIRIREGKGNKDRYTILSEMLLGELRSYYRTYRPDSWLFPGMRKDKPIATRSINRIVIQARERAGISKKATAHTLRHTFATHMLESGVDLFMLRNLLGHSSLRTTCKYVHLQRADLQNIVSPLDDLVDLHDDIHADPHADPHADSHKEQ
jgi:site-specific recombinase XerD